MPKDVANVGDDGGSDLTEARQIKSKARWQSRHLVMEKRNVCDPVGVGWRAGNPRDAARCKAVRAFVVEKQCDRDNGGGGR